MAADLILRAQLKLARERAGVLTGSKPALQIVDQLSPQRERRFPVEQRRAATADRGSPGPGHEPRLQATRRSLRQVERLRLPTVDRHS
jgi:hypothetical protein